MNASIRSMPADTPAEDQWRRRDESLLGDVDISCHPHGREAIDELARCLVWRGHSTAITRTPQR
jgi:hypothetical protein